MGKLDEWANRWKFQRNKILQDTSLGEQFLRELAGIVHEKLRFIDTIKTLAESTTMSKYNFVVIDNPQNLFGLYLLNTNEPQYCEHFDVLPYTNKILDDGIVIFNVNLVPYNYDKFPLWKKRREKFYGKVDTSNLKLDFVSNFYKNFFTERNFQVLFHTYVRRITPNPFETLYYFAYHLRKKDS
jgi:hypothetical protein